MTQPALRLGAAGCLALLTLAAAAQTSAPAPTGAFAAGVRAEVLRPRVVVVAMFEAGADPDLR